MTRIDLIAPAKLTWSLRVVGVRADGLHLIDAEMTSLDLHDRLVIEPDAPELAVDYAGPHRPRRPIHPSDDLVLRALRLAGRRARVEVAKHVPAGAGLGGGSADAAAVLRWAGVDDPAVAAQVGADVAFCLIGGRARVRGIGEIVEPLAHVDRTVTLLTPPVHCSTPAVYRRWDELGGPVDDRPDGNDLVAAALSVHPELARWRDELGDGTGVEPRLAGSGSTWFVEGAFEGPGRVVTHTVAAVPPMAERA